jgi:hypothetical protein
MTPEEYIVAVEEIAKKNANNCWNQWRETLAEKYGKEEIHANLEERPICSRCEFSYISGPHCIHGKDGDYENFPEIYLADALTNPWHDHKNKYMVYMYDLIRENAKYMKMTEDEICEGLLAILEKYPRIGAFVSYNLLYVAIIARMPRVITLVTEWLERRNSWFTPGAEFEAMTETLLPDPMKWETRLDLPPIAREGQHNIPKYIQLQDWSASTTNTDHAIQNWVDGPVDEKCPKTPWTEETIEILARALAANTAQWRTVECSSMNAYPVMTTFVGCVCHCVGDDGKQIDILPQMRHLSTPIARDYQKIVWHTVRSRCALCPGEDHEGHSRWRGSCYSCLPDVICEPIPMKPFERVVAKAVAIRRRRLRGVFWCSAVLVGRARQMHYRPGIGSAFKEAQSDFYAVAREE